MKTILTSLMAILLSSQLLFAQTTTKYYDYYGREIGSAKTEPTYRPPVFQGSPYQSSIPLGLIQQAAAQKQQLIDQRFEAIQEQVDNISSSIENLFRNSPSQYKYFDNKLDAVLNKLNNGNYDLSLSTVYFPIRSELKALQEAIYRTHQDMMTSEK